MTGNLYSVNNQCHKLVVNKIRKGAEMYTIWTTWRNGDASGWQAEDYNQALRMAYGKWRERKEFNYSVSITMGDTHRTTVLNARELTNYLKKNILQYV